jgi:hypothetical protein
MDLSDFTNLQRQALLDLALVAMYSDAHLAVAENERVQRLLTWIGFASDSERHYELNTAIARVRKESETEDGRHRLIARLAHQFPTDETRQRVCAVLEDLLKSDKEVATAESQFLVSVRRAMGLEQP